MAGLVGAGACGTAGSSASGAASGGNAGAPVGNPAPGELTPSSPSVSFGSVAVGTPTSQMVSLQNTGGSNVNIGSVSITGNGMSVSGGSDVTLTPNQSVNISVNFDPSGTDLVQGTLSVPSNASNSLLQLPVSGTGFVQSVQHTVNLSWQPSTSVVVGYYIYRGPSASSLAKLTGTINKATTYSDSSVSDGQTYVYAVTAVDSSNVESLPSTPITVTIPAN